MCYSACVDFIDFMIWKLIVLAVIVFAINLVYTAITGKSIEQARRDTATAKQDRH